MIICDDVRDEVGNKASFMGVYQKDIFVPKIPFIFPKLCFVINYGNITGGDTFSIELIGPQKDKLGNIIKGGTPKNIKGYAVFQIHAVFSPLKVEMEGDYILRIMFNNDKKRKKEIKFAIKEQKGG